MLFNKNKTVDLVALKETDPKAYAEIVNDAKDSMKSDDSQELESTKTALAASNAKVVAYEKKEAKEANDAAILAYGEKLGVLDSAKEAVKEGKDFSSALKDMVDVGIKNKEELIKSFDSTASNKAGKSTDTEDSDDSPKTFAEAISMISSRDSISKKEALVKAKVEFKDLLDNIYEK